MEDKKKISFNDASRLAHDILSKNTDSYIFFAVKSGDCASGGGGETEDIINAIATYMEDETIREIILSAVATYAEAQGNVTELKLPQDISSN